MTSEWHTLGNIKTSENITPEEFNRFLDETTSEETKLREKMEAEYLAYVQPFEEEFEEATKVQREKAIKVLTPVKTRIDKKIAEWKMKLMRKIDKEMLKYNSVQKRAQNEFNLTTINEKALYEEQIKDRKEQFETEWAAIAKINDEMITTMRSKIVED